MHSTVGKFTLAAVLAGAFAMGAAVAAPTCTQTNVLPASGQSILAKSLFTSGYCVEIKDKLYGNFNLASLPSATVVIFNLNSIGANDYYGISFDATFANTHLNPAHHVVPGHQYDWSYEMAVVGAPPGTKMVQIATDFTQTAGGPSTLTEDITQGGVGALSWTKNGAIGSGTSLYNFNPGITDLVIDMHLFDKGTISSVENTVVQFVPTRNRIPEPLSLSILGAGLAGLSMLRRKRRD